MTRRAKKEAPADAPGLCRVLECLHYVRGNIDALKVKRGPRDSAQTTMANAWKTTLKDLALPMITEAINGVDKLEAENFALRARLETAEAALRAIAEDWTLSVDRVRATARAALESGKEDI